MSDQPPISPHAAWAQLRFAVVGPLLSAPPAPGQLRAALVALSHKTWRHPVTGEPVRFAPDTIERWYYQARRARQDPVGALRRSLRKDAGAHPAVHDRLATELLAQYRQNKHWSVKLHYDNLLARIEADPTLGPAPSYASVRRFMRAHGLEKRSRPRHGHRAGAKRAEARHDARETRSFEAEHVNGLWHLDFHSSNRPLLTPAGQWLHPKLIAISDDRSRLAVHAQWYFSETAEVLVHALVQAVCKAGLPRALLTDNGAAMMAEELVQGLTRLGIQHDPTLPYSPHQNGKQEVFWATLEGRLMAMLEDVADLSLHDLNHYTHAWIEMEYKHAIHRETGDKPIDRFRRGPSVTRPSPTTEALEQAFRQQVTRAQRKSDGTLSLEGVRFEIPDRFRHMRRLTLRYARWNLQRVHIVDPRTETLLTPIYPLEKRAHAGRKRRPRAELTPEPAPDSPDQPMAPLLRKLLADYAATGRPPPYLAKPDDKESSE